MFLEQLKRIKEPTPTLGHCKNREKCVCFSFIFQTTSPETLLSVLFVLHITSLSIIERKTRKLKLRMRENRIGHRFLHFLIMTHICIYVRLTTGPVPPNRPIPTTGSIPNNWADSHC